jgi:hypothetical protein
MQDVFKKFDTKLKTEIRQNLSQENINASGNASNSLRSETTKTKYTLYGSEYFKYIDKGRGEGGIPRNFIGILLQWIRNKGLSVGEKEDKRFAGAIAHKIKTEGSSKRRGSRPQTNVVEDAIDSSLPVLTGDIITTLKQDYKSEVLKYLSDVN